MQTHIGYLMTNTNYKTRIRDLVIIITGASFELGASTAVHLAEFGPRMVLVSKNEDVRKLNGVALRCYSANSYVRVLMVTGDVKEEDDVMLILQRALDAFGRIDCLINCDGVIARGLDRASNASEYMTVVDAEVDRSIYTMTMKTVPLLMETKGSIVTVGAYNDCFTGSLALEMASFDIRVNLFDPGKHIAEKVDQTNYTLNRQRVNMINQLGTIVIFLVMSESFIEKGLGSWLFGE